MDLSVYVPCFNEVQNIGPVIETITEALRPLNLTYEILIFDDGSTDGTGDVVAKIARENPGYPIRLFRNDKNLGLGTNYFRGADEAHGKYYMMVNGDNDAPVELMRTVLNECGKYDMVIPHLGKNDKRSCIRRLLSRTFTRIVQILSGTHLRYYNCAVLHLTENIRSAKTRTFGYGYQAELLCELLSQGKTYTEVEVPHLLRGSGRSKAFRFSNVLAVLGSLNRIFQRRLGC